MFTYTASALLNNENKISFHMLLSILIIAVCAVLTCTTVAAEPVNQQVNEKSALQHEDLRLQAPSTSNSTLSVQAISNTTSTLALSENPESFTLGVIADCQYADQVNKGQRFYQSCPEKLHTAINDFNSQPLASVLHLGDFIDQHYDSFAPLINITKELNVPFHHVLGNHDFSVADLHKNNVTETLKMPARYYSFSHNNWLFIALDGNDVSTYGWPEDSQQHQHNMALIKDKYQGHESWNGAIGEQQLLWLKQQLAQATSTQKNVVLLSHFPVYPENRHNLWNAEIVVDLITQYPAVKAWFNGHNHAGNYGKKNNIHFVTFHGMLDTPETAYSTVTFTDNAIKIKGIGRQPSMFLAIN